MQPNLYSYSEILDTDADEMKWKHWNSVFHALFGIFVNRVEYI